MRGYRIVPHPARLQPCHSPSAFHSIFASKATCEHQEKEIEYPLPSIGVIFVLFHKFSVSIPTNSSHPICPVTWRTGRLIHTASSMAKEKTRATARADAASRQSAVDKRHRVAKKVSKPNNRDRYPKTGGSRVDLPARLQLNKPNFKSYFEFQENKDKKDKKLETSVTKDKSPPPGFSFVPVGNPELSKKCKELSREAGYLIFIVSVCVSIPRVNSYLTHFPGHHGRTQESP